MGRAGKTPRGNGTSSGTVALADLAPDPGNVRRHPARNVQATNGSVKRFGAARSIVIDGKGVVRAGNATLEAARSAGIKRARVIDADGTELIVVRRKDWTDQEARAYAVADNRAGDLSEWDDAALLAQLDGLDAELREATGFLDAEIAELRGPTEGETDPDEIPEEVEPKTKPGDLWILGEHRLLCGDSTKPEDVERLMAGEKAGLVYTDPPYGVDYDGGTKVREKLAGDASTMLYDPACAMAFAFSDESAPLYLWHAGVKGIAAAAAGYEIRCEIVWNKNQAQFGALSAHYKQKHEPCYYCVKRGKATKWCGPTNEVTVWDCDRASVNEFHPTQKPVDLAVRAMRNHRVKIVADWFAGSGSTIIAAEQLSRRCFAVEIEPRYVDVAVARWEKFTGKKARLEKP